MNYNVKTIDVFERQAKRLFKKYISLKSDLGSLIADLRDNPRQGTDLGGGCYKVRLKITSKGKGKSAGARVITNIVVAENNVYLLAIYDKSEKEDLSDKEIQQLINRIQA